MRYAVHFFPCFLLLIAFPVPAEEPAGGGVLDFLRSETASKYDLDPAAPDELIGVVVDDKDQGVPGATVYLRPYDNWDDTSLKRATTDRRGQFAFENLTTGRYAVTAVEGTRASRTKWRKWAESFVRGDESGEPVVLELGPARQTTVQVVDAATGAALPGAIVALRSTDLPREYQVKKSGQVVIAGLLPSEYSVAAEAPGYARLRQQTNLVNRNSSIQFSLHPGATLAGVVRDEQGQPVADAYVDYRDADDSGYPIDSMRTDSEGAYHFDHVATGMTIELSASRGQTFLDYEVDRPPLKAGEEVEFDITLKRRPYGGAIDGVVMDENNRPVAGASITNFGRSSSDKRTAITDDRGRYFLGDVFRSSRGHYVCVQAPGYIGIMETFTPGTRDRPHSYAFILQPGNTIAGRVVNEAGEPVSGAYVRFGEQFFGVGGTQRTGDDGKFRFDTLPEEITFEISAKGYSDVRRKKLPLNEPGEVEVILTPPGILRGQVVDAETDEPIEDFTVRATFSPERTAEDPSASLNNEIINPGQKHSSPDGKFDIGGLVVGHPLMVTVDVPSYRPATIRRVVVVRPDDETRAEFRLTPIDPKSVFNVSGTIAVASAEGEPSTPVDNAQVCLLASVDGKGEYGDRLSWYDIRRRLEPSSQLQQRMQTTTDESGHFEFQGVWGDLFVEIAYWSEGIPAGRLSGIEKMTSEQRTHLKLETVRAAALTLTFDEHAFPVVSRVQLHPTERSRPYEGEPLLASHSRGDSQWRVSSIPPGEYRLQVWKYEREDGTSGRLRSIDLHQQTLAFKSGEQQTLHLDKPTPTAK